ncbi:MAG: radical SAM protein [candidate division Zixibacteria bacterium]|nr:radical SAM protein [candidate division Zixibacteria bacterium]
MPPKSCSFNCVYCQLGRTRRTRIERVSFCSKERVFEEIARQVQSSEPDFITFAGDGEPTLSRDLGWLADHCRRRWPSHVAVITNSSLLFRDDVREELAAADVVLASLDVGCEATFRALNRPHPDLSFANIREGLMRFAEEYSGKLWLETMLVADANDSHLELTKIRDILKLIGPDRTYVTVPIRPPAESWVTVPPADVILRAQRILGDAEPVADREAGGFGLSQFSSARQAIVEIGSRHPLRRDQAESIAAFFSSPGTVANMLQARELIDVHFGDTEYVLPSYFNRDPEVGLPT